MNGQSAAPGPAVNLDEITKIELIVARRLLNKTSKELR